MAELIDSTVHFVNFLKLLMGDCQVFPWEIDRCKSIDMGKDMMALTIHIMKQSYSRLVAVQATDEMMQNLDNSRDGRNNWD